MMVQACARIALTLPHLWGEQGANLAPWPTAIGKFAPPQPILPGQTSSVPMHASTGPSEKSRQLSRGDVVLPQQEAGGSRHHRPKAGAESGGQGGLCGGPLEAHCYLDMMRSSLKRCCWKLEALWVWQCLGKRFKKSHSCPGDAVMSSEVHHNVLNHKSLAVGRCLRCLCRPGDPPEDAVPGKGGQALPPGHPLEEHRDCGRRLRVGPEQAAACIPGLLHHLLTGCPGLPGGL